MGKVCSDIGFLECYKGEQESSQGEPCAGLLWEGAGMLRKPSQPWSARGS